MLCYHFIFSCCDEDQMFMQCNVILEALNRTSTSKLVICNYSQLPHLHLRAKLCNCLNIHLQFESIYLCIKHDLFLDELNFEYSPWSNHRYIYTYALYLMSFYAKKYPNCFKIIICIDTSQGRCHDDPPRIQT